MMKQYFTSACVFAALIVAFLLTKPSRVIPESEVKLVLVKDSCKVYSFKVFENFKYKNHFFTTCKGAVIDKDDFNITELENEATNY